MNIQFIYPSFHAVYAGIYAFCAVVCCFSLGSCEPAEDKKAAEQQAAELPYSNVVFIVSDDHHPDVMGAYGNEIIATPNLDKLASESLLFHNAYSNSPICSASRQSIMTGKYPHATGVNLLFTPFPDDGNITIAEILKEKGYKTALVGKNHFNSFVFQELYKEGKLPDHGWDHLISDKEYKDHLRQNPPREIPSDIRTRESVEAYEGAAWTKNADMLPVPFYDEDSKGTYFAQWAADFINKNKKDPFCLWVAFKEPHAPFSFPVEYVGRYNPEDMPLPTGSAEDDRWVPLQFKNLTEQERRGIIASYYTSVEYMDKNVGIVLDALRDNGLEENTLVVFNGDQGYLLNEHKRFEKHTFWRESIKAPLMIKGKNLRQEEESDALVEFVDLVPTVIEALGFEAHPDFQGKSFLSLLSGEKNKAKDHVFAQYLQEDMAMVADKEWKYIFATGKYDLDIGYETGYGPAGIHHRLYNLKKDPEETKNLAYESAYAEKVNELQALMLQKFTDTHPDAALVPNELNRTGQLVWFCQPRDIGAHYKEEVIRYFFHKGRKTHKSTEEI